MKKYLIKVISEPTAQHPTRYLDVISKDKDNLIIQMDQYSRNRHLIHWSIEKETDTSEDTPVISKIKYKYDSTDPVK
tara:strand:- start:1076 stop:1306 length:231 start_codon:yes stop_codon:yes gene_type:complete